MAWLPAIVQVPDVPLALQAGYPRRISWVLRFSLVEELRVSLAYHRWLGIL